MKGEKKKKSMTISAILRQMVSAVYPLMIFDVHPNGLCAVNHANDLLPDRRAVWTVAGACLFSHAFMHACMQHSHMLQMIFWLLLLSPRLMDQSNCFLLLFFRSDTLLLLCFPSIARPSKAIQSVD